MQQYAPGILENGDEAGSFSLTSVLIFLSYHIKNIHATEKTLKTKAFHKS
jgi:hypothetical protein